jgi:hypothetical protein
VSGIAQGYHFTLASAVGARDGIGLEVTRDDNGECAAEVFLNHDTGERTFTAFEPSIPVEVVAELLERAREQL